MRAFNFVILATIVFIYGCTAISRENRLDQFKTLASNYERALRMSDFKTAFHFLDPAIRQNSMDERRFSNIKIFQHRGRNIKISPDSREISQDVELQYYLLDRNILHTRSYKEIWRYNETKNVWLLETALPIF